MIERNDGALLAEHKCCSAFAYMIYSGQCCCTWIDDGSEFPALYTKKFTAGKDEFWTCNSCTYGFSC